MASRVRSKWPPDLLVSLVRRRSAANEAHEVGPENQQAGQQVVARFNLLRRHLLHCCWRNHQLVVRRRSSTSRPPSGANRQATSPRI